MVLRNFVEIRPDFSNKVNKYTMSGNDMIIPIKLAEATKKYSITSAELFELAKENKIVMIIKDSNYIIDEKSIKSYLKIQEYLKKHDEYLKKIIYEKRIEVNDLIAKYDDYLFVTRTLSKNEKIFKILISMLSQLIKNEIHRDIFLNVSLGKDIYDIGKKHDFDFAKTSKIYKLTVENVKKKCLILDKYRQENVELKKKIEEKEASINNLRETIQLLEKAKGIIADPKNTPEYVLFLANLNFQTDFNLDYRCKNCLKYADIYTIRDLIYYLSNHGGNIKSLLKIKRFGPISFEMLRKELLEKGIIDEYGNSYLLEQINDINLSPITTG